MNIIPTAIPEVLIIEPKVFADSRGFFFEAFNAREFSQQTGVNVAFVQDNHSRSQRGVLRGLHYQLQNPQGKLVRVVQGAEQVGHIQVEGLAVLRGQFFLVIAFGQVMQGPQ